MTTQTRACPRADRDQADGDRWRTTADRRTRAGRFKKKRALELCCVKMCPATLIELLRRANSAVGWVTAR